MRFAIVTDDAADVRNLPYEAAMARAFGLPADGGAARDHALAGRDLRRGGPAWARSRPGKDANLVVATGDIMDHRTRGDARVHRRRGAVAGDPPHAALPASSRTGPRP